MATHKDYQSYLIQSLTDPAEAAAYLDAVFEDGDLEHILLALKNVAEAQTQTKSGITTLDGEWKQGYAGLTQQFTQNQDCQLASVSQLLNKLGLRLSVQVNDEQAA